MPQDIATLRTAAEAEIERYIHDRRTEVDAFVSRRFALPTVARSYGRTLHRDLIRLTLNLALALPSLVIRRAAGLAEKLGFDGLLRLIEKLPLPLTTVYERSTQAALLDDLFGMAHTSPLTRAMCANATITHASVDYPDVAGFLTNDAWLREEAQKCLRQWTIVRSQVFDGLGSFAVIAISYVFFRTGGHSPLDVGRKLASERARQQAAGDFFLGESIGNVFYSIAPVKPTLAQIVVATAVTFLLLACTTLIVNIAADPLQRQFGAHHRQIHKAIDLLEERLVLALKRRLKAGALGREHEPSYVDTIEGIMDRVSTSSMAIITAATGKANDFASITTSYARRGTFAFLARTIAAYTVAKHNVLAALAPMRMGLRRWRLQLETRFGLRTVRVAILVVALVCCGGAYASYEALRYDPYEEPEDLIAEHAYSTAIARIDALGRQKAFKQDMRLLALRARALCGSAQYDACIETYDKVLAQDPTRREDTHLALDLAAALAHGHMGARRVLVRQIGPDARSMLEDLALEKRPIDRWAVADTLAELGAEPAYESYIRIDFALAKTCEDKRRVIDKISDRKRPEAADALQAVLADPALKCAHASAKTALAKIK